MVLTGKIAATSVQTPAAISVTKKRVTVFVKRVSMGTSVIRHVLTCVRTVSVTLNRETVLIVIRVGMDHLAKIIAHRVAVTLAT